MCTRSCLPKYLFANTISLFHSFFITINSLYIKNYALIKELNISFKNGFTSITGETGAGKSIFLGALSLILGERSDSSLLIDTSEKCIVEGEFEISRYKLQTFFEKNELDFNTITVLRREISPNGRSRSFINDTPVNLIQMKELGVQLFDIHSQNQSHQIHKKSYQLQILDAYSKNAILLEDYKTSYSAYVLSKRKLEELQNKALDSKSDQDYKQFLLDELEKSNLKDRDELNKIEEELKVLANSEDISLKISESIRLAEESDSPIIDQLQRLNNNLQVISKHSKDIESVYNRINSSLLELKDCVFDLHSLSENIVFDPDLNKIKLATIKLAKKLSSKRLESVSKVEIKVKDLLSKLGMENANLKIEMSELDFPNENGIDDIKLLFSANKGIDLAELTKVASGGEMSRLLFSVKSCIAHKMNLPTILFDEIDTGVSGEIAHKMGELMSLMARQSKMQVAARGDNQMYVEKRILDDSSHTNIRTLDQKEREKEIAKMLSGSVVTDVSLSNARELLATK